MLGGLAHGLNELHERGKRNPAFPGFCPWERVEERHGLVGVTPDVIRKPGAIALVVAFAFLEVGAAVDTLLVVGLELVLHAWAGQSAFDVAGHHLLGGPLPRFVDVVV